VNTQIDSLLKERDTAYGQSWYTTGKLIVQAALHTTKLYVDYPQYIFNWIMILNKLVRALTTPTNIEHWRDIQGYARLVEMHLNNRWKEQPSEDTKAYTESSPDGSGASGIRRVDERSDSSAAGHDAG
jgi:hypothetical protein